MSDGATERRNDGIRSCRSVVLSFCLAGFAALGVAGCARETPVEAGNRTQVLHRGIGHDLADLDPHLATGASDYNVLSALFEGLVAEDPVDLHPVPGVAEKWDVSPDGQTYVFHLRADARWSNGDPVRAEDFVGSIKRALSPSLGSDNATMLYVVKGAEPYAKNPSLDFSTVGIAATDARTLRVTLERPTANFLSQLNHWIWFPVPLSTIAKYGPVDQRGNQWARQGRIVGNGPFVLTDWKPDQEIVVAKSNTYWDASHVRLTGIHFHTIDSLDAEERAFRAGQLHLTDALPAGKIDTYRGESPSRLRIDPLLGTYFYRLNTTRPFLNEPRVRRALSLAIDRKTIVDQLLRGGQMPAYGLVPPGTAGYTFNSRQAGGDADLTKLASSADEARRILADAGYPGGRGLPVFELLYNNSENHKLIAEAIQEMWKRVLGVEVRLASQELKSTLEARRAGNYEILRSVWLGDFVDPQNFLEIFASASGNNHTGWSNTRYDALLRTASLSTGPEARFALFQEAETILLEAAPIIPIYHYTHVFVIQPSVKGWNPTLLDHHPYKAVWLE